jgi:hypothetical protein|eukprot:COSAG06_NODE_72_length_25897_cov_9.227382_12_plen_62_part_00
MGARAYVKVDCSFLHGTLHYRGPHLDPALLGLLVGGVVRAAAHAHPPHALRRGTTPRRGAR